MSIQGRGFHPLEMIVVLLIIIALSGVVLPIIEREVEESRHSQAQEDLNQIAKALLRYTYDTSLPPTGPRGAFSYHYIWSDGDEPANNGFASGTGSHLSALFNRNDGAMAGWNGPYLKNVGTDPWGSQYLVNTHGYFYAKERVWVLSPGPNREVETSPGNTTAGGDDLGIFIE